MDGWMDGWIDRHIGLYKYFCLLNPSTAIDSPLFSVSFAPGRLNTFNYRTSRFLP